MSEQKDHPFKSKQMPLAMKLNFMFLSIIFKILGTISHKLAGKLALHLFMIPPKVSPPKREQNIREQADLSFRKINGQNIAVKIWENQDAKEDTPTILLSHGWAGRTTQFLKIIEPLVNAGYRVIGADISAHGDSSGKNTNILEGSHILSTISKEFGPFTAIIGHSFGTGTILLAMDKLALNSPKIILISAYSRVSFIIDLFSEVFDLNENSKKAMKQAGTDKLNHAFNIKWDWESISPIHTIKSYEGEILFIHDNEDNEVPINEVTELHQAKPNAEILLTSSFGHRRILRNEDVIQKILGFIRQDI